MMIYEGKREGVFGNPRIKDFRFYALAPMKKDVVTNGVSQIIRLYAPAPFVSLCP